MNGTWNSFLINNPGAVTVGSNLATNGAFSIASGPTLNMGTYTVTLAKNWLNSGGGLSATANTVVLNGTNQSISGSTTFYNLTKSNSASTLTFEAGSTQTITNSLTLTGNSLTTRMSLRSSSAGSAWNINAQGSRSLCFLDVRDSNNTNGTAMAATDTSVDSGNNTNWTFTSATADKKIFLTSTTYTGILGRGAVVPIPTVRLVPRLVG